MGQNTKPPLLSLQNFGVLWHQPSAHTPWDSDPPKKKHTQALSVLTNDPKVDLLCLQNEPFSEID
jgi:hypothetical protein